MNKVAKYLKQALVELQGIEKQINWANKIRPQLLDKVENHLKQFDSKLKHHQQYDLESDEDDFEKKNLQSKKDFIKEYFYSKGIIEPDRSNLNRASINTIDNVIHEIIKDFEKMIEHMKKESSAKWWIETRDFDPQLLFNSWRAFQLGRSKEF
jgi:hypothetical protein